MNNDVDLELEGVTNTDYPVSKFMSIFNNIGIAKANKFRVEFFLPDGVNAAASQKWVNSESTAGSIMGAHQKLNRNMGKVGAMTLLCHTCTFPQRVLATHEHKQLGAPYRVPHSATTYDPVSFSFYADSDMNSRHYFEIWQNAAINIGNNSVNFYDEFVRKVRIYQLDDAGNDTYYVTLWNAFPLSIGAMDVSFSSNDTVQNVTVTLSYKYWQSSYEDAKVSSAV